MARTVTIIGSFVSPYVRKVLACLTIKGVAYAVDPITPFFGNDDYAALSPLRRIPVLIDGDFVISDSSVICAYVEEAFDGPPLLPADPKDRARARWLEEYADTRLGELIIWSLFYQKVVRPMVWGEAPDEARIAEATERGIPEALDYLEGQAPAEGYLFGPFGLADIAVASFFRNAAYADVAIDPARWPKAAGWVERSLAHPSIAGLLPFEDVQRSIAMKGRRQALLEAGAPLSERSWGLREPRRGRMPL
ncbi:MAG: glutathione S-transferase family protein [Sphingomicrobium sp.]